MPSTNNLGLLLLAQNQLNKDILINENLSILDSLIAMRVISLIQDYPICNAGDSYLIGSSNLPDSIKDYANYIIIRNYNNDGWIYIKPKNNQLVIIVGTENKIYSFSNINGWKTYENSYAENVDSHSHSNKSALDLVVGLNTGDETNETIKSKRPLKTIAKKSLEGSGDVVLSKNDLGLENVDNTKDSEKPISNVMQNALDLKADKNQAMHKINNLNDVLDRDAARENLNALKKDDNLASIPDKAIARGNLGVYSTSQIYTKSEVDNITNNKIDKIAGKGLSSNDYTSAEKSKLSIIQDQATKNDTDANLKNRTNHTGTQLASTITGLSAVATSGNYNDLTNKPNLTDLTGVNSVNDFTIRKQNNTNEGGEIRFQLPDDKGIVIIDVVKGSQYNFRIFSSINGVVQVPFQMNWNLNGVFEGLFVNGVKVGV